MPRANLARRAVNGGAVELRRFKFVSGGEFVCKGRCSIFVNLLRMGSLIPQTSWDVSCSLQCCSHGLCCCCDLLLLLLAPPPLRPLLQKLRRRGVRRCRPLLQLHHCYATAPTLVIDMIAMFIVSMLPPLRRGRLPLLHHQMVATATTANTITILDRRALLLMLTVR